MRAFEPEVLETGACRLLSVVGTYGLPAHDALVACMCDVLVARGITPTRDSILFTFGLCTQVEFDAAVDRMQQLTGIKPIKSTSN